MHLLHTCFFVPSLDRKRSSPDADEEKPAASSSKTTGVVKSTVKNYNFTITQLITILLQETKLASCVPDMWVEAEKQFWASFSTAFADLDNSYVRLPVHFSTRYPANHQGGRFGDSKSPDGKSFDILSRQLAIDIRSTIDSLLDDKKKHSLYLYGAKGVGKSHSLYQVAMELMKEDVRVVYIHDCGGLPADTDNAMQFLCGAIYFGFHGDEEIQDACKAVSSLGDFENLVLDTIPTFCKSKDIRFCFIFDQHNGLSAEKRKLPMFEIIEKGMANSFMWNETGCLVISASANNKYFLDVSKNVFFSVMDVYYGFSDAERVQWANQNNFFPKSDYRDFSIPFGNLPLYLSEMKRQYSRMKHSAKLTLADVIASYSKELKMRLNEEEQKHRIEVTGNDVVDKKTYESMILCITSGAPVTTSDSVLMNVRRLYNRQLLHLKDDVLVPNCNFVLDMYRSLRILTRKAKSLSGLDEAMSIAILKSRLENAIKGTECEQVITGYLADISTFTLPCFKISAGGILSVTTTPENIRFDNASLQWFSKKELESGELDFKEARIFVPRAGNNEGIDFYLWDPKTKRLLAVQVTVGPMTDHSQPDSDYLALWEKKSKCPALDVVWCTPFERRIKKKNEKFARDLFLSFSDLPKEISNVLSHLSLD